MLLTFTFNFIEECDSYFVIAPQAYQLKNRGK